MVKKGLGRLMVVPCNTRVATPQCIAFVNGNASVPGTVSIQFMMHMRDLFA